MRSRISLILFSSIFFFWAFSLSAKHQVALFNYYHDLIIQKAYEMQLEDPGSQKAEDLINFCSFHRTLKEARFREGGYYSLTAEEISILEDIAKTESPVAYNAIAVLNWLKREADDWEVEPVIELQSFAFEENHFSENSTQKNIFLSVSPNPFDENTSIIIEGITDENAVLVLSDITGKIILSKVIYSETKTINITGDELRNGIYICSVYLNGNLSGCKKLIRAK